MLTEQLKQNLAEIFDISDLPSEEQDEFFTVTGKVVLNQFVINITEKLQGEARERFVESVNVGDENEALGILVDNEIDLEGELSNASNYVLSHM
jgi:hypothetical protein